ncbi:hypothetical protein Fluta_0676 [Fluviicola taffensis DSM 16823]|uniref:Uncharacterized protein n=1 Tax=Fluviicola taffensis (strain DSM 16823 / NCIMB 13979 / RW262) TaxID=755732 RepID=F2IHC5_FLUTR|nr:hypothetical protein Fluta_0676 [Fluviicola taffensis DSM 16823]
MEKYISPPVEENYEYVVFKEYLETKDSPKAKKLLEKLNSLKTCEDYLNFKSFLLWDLFIEAF